MSVRDQVSGVRLNENERLNYSIIGLIGGVGIEKSRSMLPASFCEFGKPCLKFMAKSTH
jgi:hypothetical protein